MFRFVRQAIEGTGRYRFIDSVTRLGIVDKETNTKLRVLSSNGKTAMGIVGTPLLVADEPGSWEVVGGGLMHDAIETAKGKPGSPLRVVYIGTLAPARAGWWHDMIADGTHDSTYVQALQGDVSKWDSTGTKYGGAIRWPTSTLDSESGCCWSVTRPAVIQGSRPGS